MNGKALIRALQPYARTKFLSVSCSRRATKISQHTLKAGLRTPQDRQYSKFAEPFAAIPMDDLVQKSIKEANSKGKSSPPWKFDEPWKQTVYSYSMGRASWQPNTSEPDQGSNSPKTLALYSWNIDFMLPYPDSRMKIGLRHLESLINALPSDTASVLYLQECLESDIEVVTSDTWVRKHFNLSDTNTDNWQNGHYGTITLVDRRLPVKSCFRVHYSQTRMERDGLFVDVVLDNKPIRLCNSHLESLAFEPPYRPAQMNMVAKYMHDYTIDGAAVAGDFNAIQDFDKSLHSENDLKDAFLELGGSEGDAVGGHTWGQQAATVQRERFGTSRMDKVFFCGGLQCLKFERFGAGVELEEESERKDLVSLGFDKPWITDHLGVVAVFKVE